MAGIEPAWHFSHRFLRPACLPGSTTRGKARDDGIEPSGTGFGGQRPAIGRISHVLGPVLRVDHQWGTLTIRAARATQPRVYWFGCVESNHGFLCPRQGCLRNTSAKSRLQDSDLRAWVCSPVPCLSVKAAYVQAGARGRTEALGLEDRDAAITPHPHSSGGWIRTSV